MPSLWLLLTAALGMVTALPSVPISGTKPWESLLNTDVNIRNSVVENLVLGLLEDLREVMITGSNTIPILDPLKVDRLYLDDSTVAIHGLRAELKDITVSKLSKFEVNSLDVTLTSILQQRYRMELDAEIPVLNIDVGGYDFSVNALGFNLFGNGDAIINLIKPRIKLTVVLSPRISSGAIYITLQECRLVLSLGGFEPAITGMFNDPSVDEFVNLFLKHLVVDAVEFYEEVITNAVSPIIHNLANDILSDLNLIDILG